MIQDWLSVLDDSDQSDTVRALILTGAGRGSCAGADLSSGADAFSPDGTDDGALARQMMWQMLGAAHSMEGHRLDSEEMVDTGARPDGEEGVASFLEKRPPSFRMKVSTDFAALEGFCDEPDDDRSHARVRSRESRTRAARRRPPRGEAPSGASGILRAVLTLLLLVALAGLAYWRFVAGYPPAPPGLAVLFRGEAAFIDAAADVLFPSGSSLPVAGVDARLPLYVDRHLAALPRDKRLQIRALFLLVENLSLVIPGDEPGGRRRFSSLSATSRLSILEKLANHPRSPARLLFVALRAVLVLGYLGHPSNLRELGVAPFEIEPAVSDAELLFPRVGGLMTSIAFEAADRTTDRPQPPLDPNGPRHRAYAHSSRDTR